jgi:hypothetical protein
VALSLGTAAARDRRPSAARPKQAAGPAARQRRLDRRKLNSAMLGIGIGVSGVLGLTGYTVASLDR